MREREISLRWGKKGVVVASEFKLRRQSLQNVWSFLCVSRFQGDTNKVKYCECRGENWDRA